MNVLTLNQPYIPEKNSVWSCCIKSYLQTAGLGQYFVYELYIYAQSKITVIVLSHTIHVWFWCQGYLSFMK